MAATMVKEISRNGTPAKGNVLPAILFSYSLFYIVLLGACTWVGGWALLAAPFVLWGGASLADLLLPLSTRNPDPRTAASRVVWHIRLVQLWVPVQVLLIFGSIYAACRTDWFSSEEAAGLMFCVGVGTGTFGVVYAHELMHRRDRLSRIGGEVLMILVCYGHFITEHLRVHHRYVGTVRDSATSRFQESAYRFLARVLPESFASAWRVETGRLRQKGKPVWSRSNPFWRYLGGIGVCLAAARAFGGMFGIILFFIQAVTAIFLTEMINYIQHYGLTRKHLGDGSYEHTREHHSWNAPRPVTAAMLINLQRHSDHHFKPERPYPLLQTYTNAIAPRLPFGYPVMVAIAFSPQLWRWVMNRRVRKWRAEHYPEITDWAPYDSMSLPMPR